MHNQVDNIYGVGGNNPPEDTPYEISLEAILTLYKQAEGWLDGDEVASEGQAEGVQKLMRMIQDAKKEAETRRIKEVAPLNDAKQIIQDLYNPLIQAKKGKCDLAIEMCRKALVPWLESLEKVRLAEAAKARKEAEEKAAAAQAELAASRESANLTARFDAEVAIDAAKKAEKAAKKLENSKVRVSGGTGRASGLTSHWSPELDDLKDAVQHYFNIRKPEFEALVLKLATEEVRHGKRSIPGFKVNETKAVT